MSYSKSLKNTLKDKNESLFNKLRPIESAARSVLSYVTVAFPYYTPHDFNHSTNVEEILNWLVPDEIKPKMNEYELYFLIIAAWLHDWGMVATPNENAEEVRREHHIRTETNFETLHSSLGLSLAEARIVGRICRGHREEDIFDQKYEDQFFGSSNKLIRVRLLTALLRVADEIDVTQNRTPEILYFTLKPQGASQEEYDKHLSIGGIGPIAPHKLRLSGVAKTPRGVEVIEGVRSKIQSQIDSVKTILVMNGVPLDSIESRIDIRGFINKPIAFELDKKMIVKLLIGSFLYSRTDTALRELAQNAIDTCRLKKTISPEFVPSIEVEFSSQTISFEDNGIGMNFEEASEFFSRKGSSFYVSEELKDLLKGKDFDPINKFGIGVLSSFMVADKMIVETKKDNCAPCKFIIDDISEGWTYETGSRTEPGTKVTLILNEVGKQIDVLKGLNHYLKNVPLSIFVKDVDKRQRFELCQKWTFDIPEVKETIAESLVGKLSGLKPDFVLSAQNEYISLRCYHIGKSHSFEGIFDREKNCFLLNHGVYVGSFDFFKDSSDDWVAMIDCNSDVVDLKVSREDLVKNEKYTGFLKKVYRTLFDAIQLNLKEKSLNVKEFAGFVAYSKLLDDLFDVGFGYSIAEETEDVVWASEVIPNKIYAVGTKEGLSFQSGREILAEKYSRLIHYTLPLEKLEKHINKIGPEIWKNLNDSEAIIFDPPPQYFLRRESSEEFMCMLCSTLKITSTKECECSSLAKTVAGWKMEKHKTPLDSLLPTGSFFSPLVSCLRGAVVQAKSFEFAGFKPAKRDVISMLTYHSLVGQELFSDQPEIAKFYEVEFSGAKNLMKAQMTERGCFVYDLSDPFIADLLSNAEKILTDEKLKKMLTQYFRVLAMLYVGLTSRLSSLTGSIELTFLEMTIADFLDLQNYPGLSERTGELVELLTYDGLR
jgi:hypothetical protein